MSLRCHFLHKWDKSKQNSDCSGMKHDWNEAISLRVARLEIATLNTRGGIAKHGKRVR